MTTTTYEITAGGFARTESIATRIADWIAPALLRMQSLGSPVRRPTPVPSASVAELLRLADEYEASQPSYAADLRAAAQSSQ
jgi:hypothetical protein